MCVITFVVTSEKEYLKTGVCDQKGVSTCDKTPGDSGIILTHSLLLFSQYQL